MQEGRIAKNQAQAYRKQLAAIKKDTIHLKVQNEDYTKKIHEKDRQIHQLKMMQIRSNEMKSQFEACMKEMQEKDRQIERLKYILNQFQQSGPGVRGTTLVRGPSSSRSIPDQLHRQGSDRRLLGSSRSTSVGHLRRQESSHSARSAPGVIRQRSSAGGGGRE